MLVTQHTEHRVQSTEQATPACNVQCCISISQTMFIIISSFIYFTLSQTQQNTKVTSHHPSSSFVTCTSSIIGSSSLLHDFEKEGHCGREYYEAKAHEFAIRQWHAVNTAHAAMIAGAEHVQYVTN